MPERFKVVFTIQGAIQVLGFTFLPLITTSRAWFVLVPALLLANTWMSRQAPAAIGIGPPADTGPPTGRTHISVLSRDHQIGNSPNTFVTWGDRLSLSSYSQETWPYVIVNFYYRLGDDDIEHPFNIFCWEANFNHISNLS